MEKWKNGKMEKLVGMILAVTICMTSIPTITFNEIKAAVTEKEIYNGDDGQIKFKVSNEWKDGFEGQLIIKNTGNKPIENWKIKLIFNQKITSIWDATIESHKENEYVIKYPSWNSKIKVGEKVIIGFNAKKNKKIRNPNAYIIPTEDSIVAKEDYDILYKTKSDWKDAFNGEMSIKNNSKKAIEGWNLEFDFDKNIRQFWNAKIIQRDGNHYVIKNDDWNSIIKPGQTIKLGFEGYSGDVTNIPPNYKLIQKNNTEYDLGELDYTIDTDKDGLADCFEKLVGLNPFESDTDGDTLNDGYEVDVLDTDCFKKDTDNNGVKDNDEDFDKDGLSNLKEFTLKTDPLRKDTDSDDLDDKEEINIYKTNPTISDTDGDSITDGDEIKLKLDPFKKCTNSGIADEKYPITQLIKENEFFINDKEDKYKFSMDITAPGLVLSNLYINESRYQNYFVNNRAILGKSIDLNYDFAEEEAVTLKFRIDNKYVKNSSKIDNKKITDLRKFNIFKFFEKGEVLLPIETQYDEATNTVFAKTDELGTYCVMDMEKWMHDIGADVDAENYDMSNKNIVNIEDKEDKSFKPISLNELNKQIEVLDNKDRKVYLNNKEKKSINKQVDVTFVVDTSYSMTDTINKVKVYIGSLISSLYKEGITLHVSVVSYTEYKNGEKDYTKILKDKKGEIWATSKKNATQLLNQLEIKKGGNETPIDGLEMGRRLKYRNGAKKFMVLITDEGYYTDNRYGIKDLNEMSNLLVDKDIITSVVTSDKLKNTYLPLSENTNGEHFKINSNFSIGLKNLIMDNLKGNNKFSVISGGNLETITLDSNLEKNGKTDTDSDGLTDSKEANWDLIKTANNSNIAILPTISELMLATNKSYVISQLSKRRNSKISKIENKKVLPTMSAPNSKDTDADGVPDIHDKRPNIFDIKRTIVYQSAKKKGRTEKNKITHKNYVAPDIITGDYSKQKLLEVNKLFKDEIACSNKPDVLFESLKKMSTTLFSCGEMETVVVDMIEFFKKGSGKEYTNKILTKHAKNHKSTKNYINKIKKEVIKELKNNGGNLNAMIYKDNDKEKNPLNEYIQKELRNPTFDSMNDMRVGLKIAVNDTWGNWIEIKNYKVTKKGFSGTIHFEIYDHFGLDEEDVKKIYVRLTGFRSWFVLQHYEKYNGKYKPFINVMPIDIPFEGSF